jgi:hypothetical protein
MRFQNLSRYAEVPGFAGAAVNGNGHQQNGHRSNGHGA